jgi:hypothetical protein
MDWFTEEKITAIVAVLATVSMVCGQIAGMFTSDKAQGVKGIFLKIAKFAGGNTYADETGTSVPFTTIDIKPKEPVA